MRAFKLALSVAAIASLTAVPVIASGPKGSSPQSHGPNPNAGTQTVSKTTTSSAPKTMSSQKTTSGPKTTAAPTTTTTAKTHGNPHKTTAPTGSTTSATGTTTPSTGATSSSTGTATSPTTTQSTTRLNPIAAKIASKPQLSSRIKSMLPAGMTLNQASKGFKNQGQFIAALHVSQNLGIPFADLKTAMTGIRPATTSTTGGTTTTGTSGSVTTASTGDTTKLSLGQAIQKLRPGADADAAVERADHQATIDVRVTTTSTTTTASATATTTSTTATKRRGDGK